MQVFLSWSGARSKLVAEALNAWLPHVIQAVDPWMSQGIAKGARWNVEVSERLEASRLGIVCLTPENLHSDWLLFEAGAISKTKDAQLCTLLLDLAPEDVQGPLAQFQHTLARETDVRELLHTINQAVALSRERHLTEVVVDRMFDRHWPDLKMKFEAACGMPRVDAHALGDRELLERIFGAIRYQEEWLKKLAQPATLFGAVGRKVDEETTVPLPLSALMGEERGE